MWPFSWFRSRPKPVPCPPAEIVTEELASIKISPYRESDSGFSTTCCFCTNLVRLDYDNTIAKIRPPAICESCLIRRNGVTGPVDLREYREIRQTSGITGTYGPVSLATNELEMKLGVLQHLTIAILALREVELSGRDGHVRCCPECKSFREYRNAIHDFRCSIGQSLKALTGEESIYWR